MRHRSGNLKQSNKKHNTQGKTRRRDFKTNDVRSGTGKAMAGKDARQNRARQLQKTKRETALLTKRLGMLGSSPSGMPSPPKIVTFIPLSVTDAACEMGPDGHGGNKLTDCAALLYDRVLERNCRQSKCASETCAFLPRSRTVAFDDANCKCRLTLQKVNLSTDNMESVLDAAKVSDVLVFVLPNWVGADQRIDELGYAALTALKNQGLPAGVLCGCPKSTDDEKSVGHVNSDAKKWCRRLADTEFGTGHAKVVDSSFTPFWSPTQSSQSNYVDAMLRTVRGVSVPDMKWRSMRSYMCASECAYDGDESKEGTLKLTGYLRGRPLNCNALFHLSGIGSFRVKRVLKRADPVPTRVKGQVDDGDGSVLAVSNPALQEPLEVEAVADTLAGEQTGFTADELQGSSVVGEEMDMSSDVPKKGKKRVKGWSDYQNTWLDYGDDGNEDTAEDHPLVAEDGTVDSDVEIESIADGEDDMIVGDEDDAPYDPEAKKRETLIRRAQDEMEFPDEVDTPGDRPARDRFARYRGLKSFRSSEWDPKESLPADYSTIYQFQDFLQLQRRVLGDGQKAEDAFISKTLSGPEDSSTVNNMDMEMASDDNTEVYYLITSCVVLILPTLLKENMHFS